MSISAPRLVTIARKIVEGIRAATGGPDLHRYLQAAVALEHAVIPPYLTALFSIRPGTNRAVADILRSIVVQEMLHMVIAANVLNAIGGKPVIDKPGFVPAYPAPLPMGVEDDLIVPLRPLSLDLIEHVFMRLELPETRDNNPGIGAGPEHGFATIAEFYDAVSGRLLFLGDGIFTGDPARQVVDSSWFPLEQLYAVTNPATAFQALEIIRQQGEGSSYNPFDGEGQPAHYYRLAEILRGRRMVADKGASAGYSFSGEPVPFDPDGIIDLATNGRLEDYPPGSAARRAVEKADFAYGDLLRILHRTVNGEPERLSEAREKMGAFARLVTEEVVTERIEVGPLAGRFAAPTFQPGAAG